MFDDKDEVLLTTLSYPRVAKKDDFPIDVQTLTISLAGKCSAPIILTVLILAKGEIQYPKPAIAKTETVIIRPSLRRNDRRHTA